MKEALKRALDALENMKETLAEHDEPTTFNEDQAITAIKAALAQQEPVAKYSDIVSDGGLDPRNKFDIPPQPEERNFCSRCGKRTADLTVIHTCTPPQENT